MNHEILKKVIFDQHYAIKETTIVEREIVLDKDVNYVLVGLRRAGKTGTSFIVDVFAVISWFIIFCNRLS